MSSDEDAWEDFIDEAVSAEKYSRKLSRRVKSTFRAKFERHGDQAGTAGLGFTRTPQPEARLAIDPVAMQRAIRLVTPRRRDPHLARAAPLDEIAVTGMSRAATTGEW